MAIVTETAEVIEVDGEHAWVETRRKAVCDACAVRKGCGSGIISRMFRGRARLRVENTIGARVGERVVLGIEDSALVRASLAVYMMPLVWMLLGALAGQMAANALAWERTDGITALAGVFGLLAGFLWLRRYARHSARDPAHRPNMLRFADHGENGHEAVVLHHRRQDGSGAVRDDTRPTGH
jgi:sigma-E factor negative regulatory protein RseC